jgi:hypothetical protein
MSNPAVTNPRGGYWSNHIVAVVRAMSGPANEKPPQTNIDSLGLAFTYRLISEVIPYCDFNTNWCYTRLPSGAIITNFNYAAYVQNMQSNMFELRLTFLWPPNATSPNRKVFRAPIIGSPALVVNDPPPGTLFPPTPPNGANEPMYNLYFFQPGVFTQALP